MPEHMTAHVTKQIDFLPEPARNVGPREVVHWVSRDCVDRDREVVVADGGDFSEYEANRVVMMGHARGNPGDGAYALPIGANLWLKTAPHPKGGRGILARTIFDSDEVSLRVCSKYKGDPPSMTSWSITFLPIESGPPTREEIARRPDWAEAKTVYRKWKLIEYSAVAVPANPDAVTVVKRGKIMTDPEPAADTATAEAIDPSPEAKALDASAAVAKELPADGGSAGVSMAARFDPDNDGDDDSTPEGDTDDDAGRQEVPAFRRGDHVRCFAKHYKGHGVVMSVHKGEHVPDVDEDVYGSEDAPAARVRCYKRMGDGYAPTAHYKGVSFHDMEACPKLKPPAGKPAAKGAAGPANREPEWTAAEKAAYVASRMHDPAFLSGVVGRVNELVEVRVLGKV